MFILQVVEDHRPFDTDVSIETFFKKCSIILTVTKDTDSILNNQKYTYICRYRLMPLGRRKIYLEPVAEEERRALQLLCTPSKNTLTPKTPKTPNSLVKRMSRVSISERNWSISKHDGTKLLLKRAILADKNEKETPRVTTPRRSKTPVETPKSSKKLTNNNIEEILSMELKENSDDEIPTLIIRQHAITTPKRKTPQRKIYDETPKKVLVFEDEEETTTRESPVTRSRRITKNPTSYREEELSPVKRTPRRAVRKGSESEDDFKPVPKTPKVPRTPKTPKTPRTPRTPRASITKTPKSVSKRIFTSELTPTLHSRAHSVDNVDGMFRHKNTVFFTT